jgi:hypothetical protein
MTRAVAVTVVNLPTPAISDGHPSLPKYWAGHGAEGAALGNGGHTDTAWAGGIAGSATLIQGPNNIHAIPDPNPIWDPRTSGWTFPPESGGGGWPPGWAGDYRWSVDSLPNPGGHTNGWYWLGDPTSQDGTANIEGGARQWPCAIPGGPTWNSFFPFKPSVNSYDGYIAGERTVHHPKGVHFNSHYAEHMWTDMGNLNQPFTWLVVATVMSDPFPGYQHWILDAGRNPDACGFPRLGANFSERWISDNLPNRTGLSFTNGDTMNMFTTSGDPPLRARGAGGHHPRMFAAIYNGDNSYMASMDPFGRNISKGRVTNNSHRFMVIGREQGWIGQSHTCNLLVLEIRFWRRALTEAELDAQYAQLSSTHQFDAYKHL